MFNFFVFDKYFGIIEYSEILISDCTNILLLCIDIPLRSLIWLCNAWTILENFTCATCLFWLLSYLSNDFLWKARRSIIYLNVRNYRKKQNSIIWKRRHLYMSGLLEPQLIYGVADLIFYKLSCTLNICWDLAGAGVVFSMNILVCYCSVADIMAVESLSCTLPISIHSM